MSSGDSTDTIAQLHSRLISGDPTASAEIAEIMLPEITQYLSQLFPNLSDPHWVDSAAIDAIMNYILRPTQYHPDLSPLDKYLKISAKYDLYNYMHRGKLEQVLISLVEDVELDNNSSEYRVELSDDQNVEEEVIRKEFPTWSQISQILPDPIDQEFLLMMMEGVRETSIYAQTLMVENLPDNDQTILVKQSKDRIKKMIKRHIDPEDLK
jgi:hypothetical protein